MIATRFESPFPFKDSRKEPTSCRFAIDERNTWADESGDEFQHYDKDRFIELAHAALEQVQMEEEQKGVLQELIEAMIIKSGAPMMAGAISEQFHSQDVIERLAEDHFQQEQRRRSSSELLVSPHVLKEPSVPDDLPVSISTITSTSDTLLLVSEYLWRFFRLLLLASLVGLVYHFMCADPSQSLLK
jgi:hypothetical protein